MRCLQLASLLAIAAAIGTDAYAETLSGRVLDPNGIGVALVDIDVENLLGADPPLMNDGTDVLGNFAFEVPPGLYRVSFFPPAPPSTTLLPTHVENVVIAGPTSLGDVSVEQGVALSGVVFDNLGLPVVGANLDIVLASTGEDFEAEGDSTGTLGQFTVAIPAGLIELQIEAPLGALLPVLAPWTLDLDVQTSMSIGLVNLQPGFHFTGVVTDNVAAPVVGLDLDLVDIATGVKLFTPGDNTDLVGAFDFIVPAGTFDVEICPSANTLLVAQRIPSQVVGADFSLGTLVLDDGVMLSGAVTRANGRAIANVDLDVRPAGMPTSIFICGDDTDVLGNYAVVVPLGTYDIDFEPGFERPLLPKTMEGIVLSGSTPLSLNLEPCPFPRTIGRGVAGSGGLTPGIRTAGGATRFDNPNLRLILDNALGGGVTLMRIGFERYDGRFLGGRSFRGRGNYGSNNFEQFLSGPTLDVRFVMPGAQNVPGAGGINLPLASPPPGFANVPIYVQALVVDPAAPFALAFTPILDLAFCK